MNTPTSAPNYEAMYHDLEKYVVKSEKEIRLLRAALQEAELQRDRFKAQMDVVHLIFGGRGCVNEID
jgi:hypothetical protein